jgi:hypothetical protein
MAYPQQAFPRPSGLHYRLTYTPHGPGLSAGSAPPGTSFPRGQRPGTSPLDATMHREPPLPLQGVTPPGVVSPATWKGITIASSLIRAHAPDQLPPVSAWASLVGLCRLLPAPARNCSFPTLSPHVFPQVPGPLPRRDPMVHLPVSSHRTSAFPSSLQGRLPRRTLERLHYGHLFRGCSHAVIFRPPGLLITQVAPTEASYRCCVAVTFYIRAPHGSLPHRAPDMLVV